MRRLLLAASVALVLAHPAVADTRPTAPLPPSLVPQSQDAFETALAEAAADPGKGDNTHARDVLKRAWRSPVFAQAAPDIRHAVLLAIVSLASEARDWADAKAAITEASEMPIADAADWTSRLDIATYGRDSEDAVHALTVLAERFPVALSDLKDESIVYWRTRAANLPEGKAKQFALTDAIFKAKWTPRDPFNDMSDLRMGYALGLIEHGRLAEARTVARAATDPDIVITMRADKRFDSLGEKLSPKTATLARQAEVTALLAKNGDLLSGQVAKAETLLALHRPKEALDVIDTAIARTGAASDAFIDQDAKLAWAHDIRNNALKALGRRAESLEALAAGARVPENGRPNVNQTLNLAVAQLHAAQPKAALSTMGTVRLDLMSPYGRSVALQIKVCAQAALNDHDAAQAGLKEMRTIGDEAKNNTLVALLCLGDLDGAAALVIERLQTDDLRGRTLLMLQAGPLPDYPSAYEIDREAKLDVLRKRPDVLAAVESVGRIERYRPEDLWPGP